ncbi:hypothetical protein T484DRAFT_1971777 [Baffinella frigidus]|nr:hypothetical protein T484DRAFT_1971777 [Cryptophyta sp. CCMP2293]|eukprot:CAMPEP_0180134770 /NCGR_PEP_ID=MMETSP0986-20121125/10375_1 /TAXON_ID=697907 /ORGANISM="non described non described, Strain CCMP2293" /LENGTH=106 /DNA_ID=CAMNT_0022075225 /DNA_START=117 /DNA_END=437 /DNA_ORIENTATION=-
MADEARTVTPEMEALTAAVKIIKDANPDMGAPKVHKAVKDANTTWQVSEDRVKKAIAEACGGGAKKPAAPKKASSHEEAKKKTAAAIAKKKAGLKDVPKGTEPAMI